MKRAAHRNTGAGRRWGPWIGPVALIGAWGVCWLEAGTASRVAASEAKAAAGSGSPHGVWDGCTECHAGDRSPPTGPPRDASDALCLRCHDGARAKAEDHPVGRFFGGRSDIRRAEGFPAPQERLTCLTCHDVLPACRMERRTDLLGRFMLRGTIAPREAAYCGQCHIPDTHEKYNPHRMLDEGGGAIAAACAFCHAEAPAAGSGERSSHAALRAAEPELCLGCHGMHVDFFEPGHTGATATAAIVENLRAADRAAGLKSRDVPQGLPLDGAGRVVCSTCHNPHAAGLFPAGSVLARGAMHESGAESTAGLRVPGGALCLTCHRP